MLDKIRAEHQQDASAAQKNDYRWFQSQAVRLALAGPPAASLSPIPAPTEGEYVRECCAVLGLNGYDAEAMARGVVGGLSLAPLPDPSSGAPPQRTAPPRARGAAWCGKEREK